MAVGWSGMFVESERSRPLDSRYLVARCGGGSGRRFAGFVSELRIPRASFCIVSVSVFAFWLCVVAFVMATISPAIHEDR